MRTDVLKALIQNSTILLVAFLMVTRLARWEVLRHRREHLLQGFAFALCGILAILFSVEVKPGVLIDMRTPIIVIAVLTSGPLAGAITIVPLLLYRIIIGGAGTYAGAGIIVTAFLFGCLLRIYQKKGEGKLLKIAAGLGSAVIYYLWILILPGDIAPEVLRDTFLPLTVASVISVFMIFIIRNREYQHDRLMENLREVNDLFEELSLDENIGITVLHGTKIVHINKALLDKYGFSSFSPENSDLMKIVAPDDRARIAGYFESMKKSGSEPGTVSMDITVPGRGSHSFLIHGRRMLYRGKDCVLVVSVDITRLVRTETALKNRYNELQLSLESSGAVLWGADLSGDVLKAPEEFFEMLFYSPPEEPPMFSHFLLNSNMTGEMEKDFSDLMNGFRDTVFGEMSFTGFDGARRWFNIGARSTCSTVEEKPTGVTGIIYETTAIKEREIDLMEKEIEDLQSRKMETIGRLAGGVAHDFNNLLHVIMGYTEILKKVSHSDPVVEELAIPILEASIKGRDLVKQLLLFSRDKTPELKPVNLSEVALGFIRLLERILEENVVIETAISQDVPRVMADRGQIEQVLMNLCINSRDAMTHGGRISISLKLERCVKSRKLLSGTLHPGDYTVLAVEDTGPGIPEDKHSLVFEPFYTTKQVDKGTGLGLSTVMGIVESHSGLINTSTPPGGGFRIQLFFPALPENRNETVVKDDVPLPGGISKTGAVTVLLAEDDPRVQNLTVEGLGAAGIKVVKASNGLEAVERFMEGPDRINVLVFDVVMPVMSGPEALERIRALGYDTPVIFTTGYAGDKLSGIRGRYRIMSKPYGVSELSEDIYRVFEGKGDKEDD